MLVQKSVKKDEFEKITGVICVRKGSKTALVGNFLLYFKTQKGDVIGTFRVEDLELRINTKQTIF